MKVVIAELASKVAIEEHQIMKKKLGAEVRKLYINKYFLAFENKVYANKVFHVYKSDSNYLKKCKHCNKLFMAGKIR